MEKNKKMKSIDKAFKLAIYIPLGVLSIALVGSLALSVSYAYTQNQTLLFVLGGYLMVMVILYIFLTTLIVSRIRVVFRDGLYGVTKTFINDMANNVPTEIAYPDCDIKEIVELNTDLKTLQAQFNNATLISRDLSKAYIPLEYINREIRYVKLESFKQYLASLVYSAQNYRNVLLEVYYDLNDDVLTLEEQERILNKLNTVYSDYSHVLFMLNENSTGFYVFIPHIDSFARIKEQFVNAMTDLSVSKKTYDGLATLNARISLVCYPYSNVSVLFADLRYAKRQGQVVNFYFPNRMVSISETTVMHNSVNLNHMTSILKTIAGLNISSRETKSSLSTIKKTFVSLCNYLKVDMAGIISFDETISEYTSLIQTSNSREIFKEGDTVQKDFIDALDGVKDPDGSYYFSTRNHANDSLARYLDRLDITSGFYYVVSDNEKVYAVIYFFNIHKTFDIDSYLRESLFMLSFHIGDYLTIRRREDTFNETYKEINDILMASDYSLYRIDPRTYDLVSFSNHFPSIFKGAKVGEKCYKALYGLDKPCDNCPLKTSKKMISEIDGSSFEISLTLNEKRTKLKRLLVHNIHDANTPSDRFDRDLLINSYQSLLISLRNLYSINSRGYLLVLRIDNASELIDQLGSENYLYALRQFIQEIREQNRRRNNVYAFDQSSISILMAELGQIDVVNFCEKIYEISKKEYDIDGKTVSFNVTYLPYNFPQSYPIAEDFLKYVTRHINTLHFDVNKDMIHFPDGDYSRSASRKEFMLSVIEEQFGNKTFSVALQPIVRAMDKSIFGAEIFLRLSDNYRNMVFNADELIKVAAQYGKISLISNALINYIGELYQQFGLTVFKVYGFTRLTINTDFSYFNDENFFTNIYNLLVNYHFPRDFLGFEITEYEVFTHLDKFKEISKGILNQHIALICDQYSGEFLSIEKLKELGFSEIKIGRKLVGDIETNPKHLNEVTLLMNEAKSRDIKVTLVGVENADQYILLRDADKKCSLQGYHFYRPLDKTKFIEELRKNS